MSTKLPEVADLEKFEELGYQQTRDRNAEKYGAPFVKKIL